MKVNWIELENIKSYKKKVRITLNQDQNFIVGPNGSGKTTALQALAICLLTLVPKYRSSSSTREGVAGQKFRLEAQQFPIQHLPANYINQQGLRSISIELSLEDSFKGIIDEYQHYLQLFSEHIVEIKKNFWSCEALIEDIQNIITKLEAYDSTTFQFDFEVGIQNLGMTAQSRDGKEGVLDALSFIEYVRTIYDYLLRKALVKKQIDRGFNLVYLGADRSVNFSGQISLSKGGFDDMFNNSAQSQNASIQQYVFSNGSFDYISQSLLKIVEQMGSMRWQDGDLDAENKIIELTEIKKILKSLLGYELKVSNPPTQFDNTIFTFFDGSVEVDFEQLSSGEKSLIYFIFTLANPDIKNSFIIIDEAEVHLHGNMQNKLLEMISNSKNLKNQHFISTHSPEMINTLTISSVLRFYKNDNQTGYVNFRTDAEIGTDYDIIRLVNNQNNEKVFFADKVILVEGIKDRILIENILTNVNDTHQIIEVVEVGGKRNLALYKKYLDEIKVAVYVFADLDHLYDIKKSDLQSLLVADETKINRILKDKGSSDRKAFIESLEEYIENDDKDTIKRILDYIRSRGVRLKQPLTTNDITQIQMYVTELNGQNTYFPSRALLKDQTKYSGEIEDFLKHIRQGTSSSEAIQNLVHYVAQVDFVQDMFDKVEIELMRELFEFLALVIHNDSDKSSDMVKRYLP